MHVTCEQCQTVYKLEERLLGADGRKVRCMECHYTWHQDPPPPDEPAEEASSASDALDWMNDEPQEEVQLVSQKGQYVHEAELDIPEAVKPQPEKPPEQNFQIPVMEHRPLGMAAGQFGVFVFLALAFATLLALFGLKGPILDRAPAMAHFYRSIGFDLKAPGEGLQITGMTAESRVSNMKRTLVVQAKVANISDKPQPSPALRVLLKGAYGGVLKKWEFAAKDAEMMPAGASVPVELSFKDAPEDGKTAELKVIRK